MRKRVLGGIVACLVAGAAFVAGQHDHAATPVPATETPLRPALLLLRDGKTEDARRELNRLLAADSSNAGIHYQLARSYLMDSMQAPIRFAAALLYRSLWKLWRMSFGETLTTSRL
jgi:hypothetical protein